MRNRLAAAWTFAWKSLAILSVVPLYVLPLNRDAAWPLAYVAAVPLLVALHHRPRRYEPWLVAIAWWLVLVAAVRWLATFGTLALLAAPLFYVVPLCFLGWALRRVAPLGLPLVLTHPILFGACEWLRVQLCPGKLALGLLGYTQAILSPLIQIADVTGIPGVTFLVAAWNGLLADLLLAALAARDGSRARPGRLLGCLGALVALTAGVLAYGLVRATEQHLEPGPRIALVQPDVPHFPPHLEGSNQRSYDHQLMFTLSKVPRGSADLVVWPENALIDVLEDHGTVNPRYARDLKLLGEGLGAPLVLDAGEFPEGSPGWTHHTAFLVSREGRIQGRTRKVYLLPWTEYVPLASGLDWVFLGDRFRRLVSSVVGFLPTGRAGRLEDARPFTIEWEGGPIAFGVPICFEAASPELCRAFVRQGARFLVNPASEGLLGPSVYRQTVVINAFRAIESRVPVVRATNDGISLFLDSNGRPRSLLRGLRTGSPIHEPGVLVDRVRLDARAGATFYARHGDRFAHLLVALAAALLALAPWRGAQRGEGAAASSSSRT